MRYPEGQLIHVGDLVWWNEGVCVGYVESLMLRPEEYGSWGLDEPSIAFTNLHPFEANENKHPQNIGSLIGGATVVDSIANLEDEGVGLLSDHEKSELEWATQEAVSRASDEVRELPYCVCACVDSETGEENWHFHFVDREAKIHDSIVFPFREGTRTDNGEQVGAGNPLPAE